MPIGVMQHSVPPATIAMASPRLIISAASPMALALVAQAETVAKFGPRAPIWIDTKPAAMSVMNMVMKKGLTRSGPLSKSTAELVVTGGETADAGADDHADVVGVLVGDLESCIVEGLACRRHRIVDEAIVAAHIFAVEVRASVKVLDLGGDA